MNKRLGTIVGANKLNRLIVKTDSGRRMAIEFKDAWGVIDEFSDIFPKRFIGRKVILDMETEKIYSESDSRGGVQWEKAYYLS